MIGIWQRFQRNFKVELQINHVQINRARPVTGFSPVHLPITTSLYLEGTLYLGLSTHHCTEIGLSSLYRDRSLTCAFTHLHILVPGWNLVPWVCLLITVGRRGTGSFLYFIHHSSLPITVKIKIITCGVKLDQNVRWRIGNLLEKGANAKGVCAKFSR